MKYPTYPVYIEDVKFKDYENAKLYLTSFADNNKPALFIGNADEEQVYAICNINPEGYELLSFEFAIKDYSENEGMLNWLIDNGYVEQPHNSYQSGFVKVPLCWATNKLKTLLMVNYK